ncbi:MAG: hypothetical protein V4584_13625 [Verrucomicrobiota bacterium]
MKPLPAQNSNVVKATDSAMPSIPSPLANPTASYSTSNRRTATCPTQRVYPWLLFTSTAVAATFCLMYITKPVIMASQNITPGYLDNPVFSKPAAEAVDRSSLMPNQDRLPGENPASRPVSAGTRETPPRADAGAAFEQTNLRIQHILTAEAPGGHLAKIDLDVPVLYQSRSLRWTEAEVAEARELLTRLSGYQEKARSLRLEGAELLDSWNRLIGSSIPAGELRADSPTLPTNQQDAADTPRPAGLDTTELIQIQPAKK